MQGTKGRAQAPHCNNRRPAVEFTRLRILTFALAARLPTMLSSGSTSSYGGLISYGPNFLELAIWPRSADYVIKIYVAEPRRPTCRSSMPIDVDSRINAAELLGRSASRSRPSLLTRADEVDRMIRREFITLLGARRRRRRTRRGRSSPSACRRIGVLMLSPPTTRALNSYRGA